MELHHLVPCLSIKTSIHSGFSHDFRMIFPFRGTPAWSNPGPTLDPGLQRLHRDVPGARRRRLAPAGGDRGRSGGAAGELRHRGHRWDWGTSGEHV